MQKIPRKFRWYYVGTNSLRKTRLAVINSALAKFYVIFFNLSIWLCKFRFHCLWKYFCLHLEHSRSSLIRDIFRTVYGLSHPRPLFQRPLFQRPKLSVFSIHKIVSLFAFEAFALELFHVIFFTLVNIRAHISSVSTRWKWKASPCNGWRRNFTAFPVHNVSWLSG